MAAEASSPRAAALAALLRERAESLIAVIEPIDADRWEGASLILDLTHEQLDLPTRPPRARGQLLGETIERVLIGHYDTHRAEIEAKLRALG
jgi:hypothetical protein